MHDELVTWFLGLTNIGVIALIGLVLRLDKRVQRTEDAIAGQPGAPGLGPRVDRLEDQVRELATWRVRRERALARAA
jgi:hypothetical protein